MGRRGQDVAGPDGLLLVDKPAGISSAAVVARVRRVFGGVKAGHTGTLDPFATGLLPLGLGEGTKLAAYLTDADKTYEGIIRLGVTTDTHDRTGTVTGTAPVPEIHDEILEAMAEELREETVQVPPSFSAIKKNGRPMYELARRGEAPELDPRPVRIDRVELRMVTAQRITVEIDCSKGFYVRSLARDIGERLGSGAILESLRRTRVGRFRIEDAVTLAALEEAGGRAVAGEALISMNDALAHLPSMEVSAGDVEDLRLGRQAALLRIPAAVAGERIRLVHGADLVAVAACEGKLWLLERVFAPPRQGSEVCPRTTYVLRPPVSQTEEEEKERANRRD